MIKCIGFDLDGTLYDEKTYVESCYDQIAAIIDPQKKAEIKQFMYRVRKEKGDSRVFQSLAERYSLPENAVSQFVMIYRTCEAKIQFYPDAELFLKLQHPWKLGVLTNGGLPTQSNKCRLLNLDRFFEKICITGNLPRNQWKPAREAFLWFCDEMGVHPGECLYIGDNPENDYDGALSAGLHACLMDRYDRYHDTHLSRIKNLLDLDDFVMGIRQ